MYVRTMREAARRNVIIHVYTLENEFVGFGSGVAITEHYILTVSHVFGMIRQPLKIIVIVGEEEYPAVIIKEDGGMDGLALLYCEAINFKQVRFSSVLPTVPVMVYGNSPLLYDAIVTRYVTRQILKEDLDKAIVSYDQWLGLIGNVPKGFSGCGVWTDNGLVGVVWGVAKFGSLTITTVVDTTYIFEFLKGVIARK